MSQSPSRVLDVGNCNPDHHKIRMMLERHFDVSIDRVMFVDEALDRMRRTRYDLVLVNRLIFEDQSEGIDLLRRVKGDASVLKAPIMLVSNYADAQAAAVAEGAVSGFGKDKLFANETIERLGQYIKPRARQGAVPT